MLSCCPFIRLCTVQGDRRDGLRGGARTFNQDKRKKKTTTTDNTLSIEQTSLTFQLSRYSAYVPQTDTNTCSHTLFFQFFSQASRYKYILKNINMTIHKSTHSSNVFIWHQKWKLSHVGYCTLTHLDTKWTHRGQRCHLTNK